MTQYPPHQRQLQPGQRRRSPHPPGVLDSIEDVPVDAFATDGPRAPCTVDGKHVATVALDRSDAGITVSGIRLSACIVHAEWPKQEESQRPEK